MSRAFRQWVRDQDVIHIQTMGERVADAPDERCWRSEKRIFESRQQAEQALAEWTENNAMVEGDVYACIACGGWYITRKQPHEDE